MKIAKLIWNAVFNSLVMNAGISTRSGTSSGPLSCGVSDSLMYSARSAWRVCFIMNAFNGAVPRSTASIIVILFSDSG